MSRRKVWACLGYVVMPDHVHFVIKLKSGSLSSGIGSFSKFTARRINELLGVSGQIWQEGYFDHALRGERTLASYLIYMMHNPVRANLVERETDWKWSGVFPE